MVVGALVVVVVVVVGAVVVSTTFADTRSYAITLCKTTNCGTESICVTTLPHNSLCSRSGISDKISAMPSSVITTIRVFSKCVLLSHHPGLLYAINYVIHDE